MDTNKPRTTEVTQAELELLEACRRAPHLAGNLTYLLDRYQAETNTGMDANHSQARPRLTPNRVHLHCGRSDSYNAAPYPASRRRSCASVIYFFHGFCCAGSPTRRGCAA